MNMMRPAGILLATSLLAAVATLPAQNPGPNSARIDSVFAQWNNSSSPGCAVATSQAGQLTMSRAYGMADLEHDIRSTPATIFEAGSVSKQFTAAAVVLLIQQGKLSLDDDVRKYVPELPFYGDTIRIRHLLTHTSGLRDWGNVASIAGWPRTTRVHTHDHVLDILSRQRGVNFEPGAQYSYSNSGYNLLVIIVSRISGMPFAEFSQRHIFEPLGLKNTEWRDDFTRIVKNRAVAYETRGTGFAMDMPFENVHGNGGLLTTVADLLTWTENLETGKLGGPQFLELMHRRGVLNNGDTITYASGLQVSTFRGVPIVSHTGSTAGYRAFLARYPAQRVGVAILCNVSNGNPATLGPAVAAIVLGDALTPPPQPQSGRGGRAGGPPPAAGAGSGAGRAGAGAAAVPTPSAAELAEYAGDYYSPDVETTLTLSVDGDRLVAFRRPSTRLNFNIVARDEFNVGSLGRVRFLRDANNRIVQLSVNDNSRVFDLRFDRTAR